MPPRYGLGDERGSGDTAYVDNAMPVMGPRAQPWGPSWPGRLRVPA